VVAIVKAETRQELHQPVEEISKLAHHHGEMWPIDAVHRSDCMPVEIDRWESDAVTAARRKGIGAPRTFG